MENPHGCSVFIDVSIKWIKKIDIYKCILHKLYLFIKQIENE